MGSMPATAVLPPSSGVVVSDMGSLDVEEANVVGVADDELLAQLDVVAHQLGDHAIGDRRLLDVDLQERSLGGIHRRLAELVPVHLAQALQAVELVALALVLGEEAVTSGVVLQ